MEEKVNIPIIDESEKPEEQKSCWNLFKEWFRDKWYKSNRFKFLIVFLPILILYVFFAVIPRLTQGVQKTETNPQIFLVREGRKTFKLLSNKSVGVKLVSYAPFTVKFSPQRYLVADEKNSDGIYILNTVVQPKEQFELLDIDEGEVRMSIEAQNVTYELEQERSTILTSIIVMFVLMVVSGIGFFVKD